MRRSIPAFVLLALIALGSFGCQRAADDVEEPDDGERKRIAATALWEKRVLLQDFVSLLGEPVEQRAEPPASHCYYFRVDQASSVIACAEDESGVVTGMNFLFR